MADKKISALTAATTPLAGTEVLPIVQSGATVKVSIADVTAGRAVSATSIATGLGAVGTPAYTFTGDTNTGIWSPAAETVAVSTNGTEKVRVDTGGNFMIGSTASPSGSGTNLQVANAAATRLWLTSTGYRNFYFESGDGSALQIVDATAGAERMRITSTGNVGIGTSSPSSQLQLSTDSAAKPSSALWTIVSDERIKTETGEYTKGLDAVCALRPITYVYNGAAGFEANGKESISIIAQEAVQHFPECVGTFETLLNPDDEAPTELYNWNGHALVFALVNAVKELKAAKDALAVRVTQLEV